MIDWLRDVVGDPELAVDDRLQSLWSGYGEVVRVRGRDGRTVVVKHVAPPGPSSAHPRGWAGDRSHRRKLHSYAVEATWYRSWAPRCGPDSRVPRCLGVREAEASWTFALEDLDAAGFSRRVRRASDTEVAQCVDWLAAFHATFLGEAPAGLWPVGTYWHLATRPDELAAMDDDRLRVAASTIDAALTGARFLTIVHGDAKLANFCFADDRSGVAAVDFQYVGGGCGMKDLTYFLGSVWGSADLERGAAAMVDRYFASMRGHLDGRDVDVDALEAEWRDLEDWAWADFTRFLAGWAPGHWKLDRYARAATGRVLQAIG